MTLTKFMARSTWVAHAFEWEKLLKCHLKGKASKKLANGQNIDYSEKRKRPKGFVCPCTGVKYHNIQTCLLVYAADSGERLQDHWSSGFSSHETGQSVGGRKRENPEKNNPAHPQAELCLSHMWPDRGSNPHQTQR